jgi:signal transduction histidine kinase
LQDYVRTKGAGEAADLISHIDLPEAEWRRIVIEIRNANRGGNQPPIAAGLNTIAMVFEKLENLIKADKTDGGKVKDLLGQANNNLDDTLDSTKEKLELLSQKIADEDTGTIGGQGRVMNRKELLSSIAEIAQELMQPLTAINASLEMMLGGYVGEVNREQHTILDLANNSGAHLTYLMKELIEIVGCPTNKGVDDRFHTTSEEVVLLEQTEG